jgi:hypothetical protein
MKEKLDKRTPRRPRYERRFILFLDFLGFRELVKRTAKEDDLLPHMVKAMDRVGEIGSDDAEFYRSQQITQFSDSIVVSYRVEESSAVFDLLNGIAFCVIDLVERGFLLSGGVAVGDVLHTRKHLVGPAMVAAYDLESKIANFPRIILDPQLLKVARAARKDDHTEDEEEKYVRDFLTEDDDGRFYFDYVSWQSVVAVVGGKDESYPGYLSKVGKLLEKGLTNERPEVLEKYLWLHSKYVGAIADFERLPKDHKYCKQTPGQREALAKLPKYADQAKAAQATVHPHLKKKGRKP